MNVSYHTLDKNKIIREKQLRRVKRYSRVVRFNRLVDTKHPWFTGYDPEHEVECVLSALDVGLVPIVVLCNVNEGVPGVQKIMFQDFQELEAKHRKREQGAADVVLTEADLTEAYQVASICMVSRAINQKTKADGEILNFIYEQVKVDAERFPEGTVAEIFNPDVWGFPSWRDYVPNVESVPLELATNALKDAWGKEVTPHGSFLYDDGQTISPTLPPTGHAGYVCEYGVAGSTNLKQRFEELHFIMSGMGVYSRIPHQAVDSGYFELWRTGQTEKLWTPAAYQKLLTQKGNKPADFVIIPTGVDPR